LCLDTEVAGGSRIAWDIETVPDLKGFAAANGHEGKSDEEIWRVTYLTLT